MDYIISNLFKTIFSTTSNITLNKINVDDKYIKNIEDKINHNITSHKITFKISTDDELKRYKQIIDLYSTKHYWLGINDNGNKIRKDNEIITFSGKIIGGFPYEQSAMKVVCNTTGNYNDYMLIFKTLTENSLVDGYYKWHFKYNKSILRIKF